MPPKNYMFVYKQHTCYHMSSRKKAIARIVADEVARETRRQQHRYAADMEPVYIALYENQLAEQRLAQLLACMAPASTLPRHSASAVSRSSAIPSPPASRASNLFIREHVPEVKGPSCRISYGYNSSTVVLSSNHDNIIDAILDLWKTSRERGEAKWPVFVKKETTDLITEWAMLCEASKLKQVSVNLMEEVQLPAVYTQAKLRYGSDDLITIHLPILTSFTNSLI